MNVANQYNIGQLNPMSPRKIYTHTHNRLKDKVPLTEYITLLSYKHVYTTCTLVCAHWSLQFFSLAHLLHSMDNNLKFYKDLRFHRRDIWKITLMFLHLLIFNELWQSFQLCFSKWSDYFLAVSHFLRYKAKIKQSGKCSEVCWLFFL